MAARASRSERAAAWSLSIGLHLALLAAFILARVAPLAAQSGPVLLDLTPPIPSQAAAPRLSQAPPAPAARQAIGRPLMARQSSAPAPPTLQAIPPPMAPAAASPAPAAAPVANAPRAAPGAPDQAPATRAPPATGGPGAGLVDILRQSFGCSSPEYAKRTDADRAACATAAAARAKTLPDHSGDAVPPDKAESYERAAALRRSPGHVPGTDCAVNSGKNGVGVNLLQPFTCASGPGAGEKPSGAPSLQDLGLAH